MAITGHSTPAPGFASLSDDGLELFFQAEQTTLWTLWHTTRPALDQPFAAAEQILTSLTNIGDPSISADGSTLYFESGATIWVATRAPM